MPETGKRLCPECHAKLLDAEILRAPNPFDAEVSLTGCPRCKDAVHFLAACDEPGCWQEGSCGTPVPNGYRFTCYEHRPQPT